MQLACGSIILSNQTPSSPEISTDKSGLQLRVISATVGIPIVLLAVFGGVYGISALVLMAAVIAGHELALMAKAIHPAQRIRYLVPVVFLVVAGIVRAIDPGQAFVAVGALGLAMGVTGVFNAVAIRTGFRRIALPVAIAVLYFGITLAHAAPLADLDSGRQWLLLAILGTFAVDTGAYFTGRAIGRHKLAPVISPKKTWEGVAGGAIASVTAVVALGAVLDLPLSVLQACGIGLAVTVSGVLGDLFESWLKRRAGVKDSGRLLPGHGGILDRIDSLAPNIAVVYWAIQIVGM